MKKVKCCEYAPRLLTLPSNIKLAQNKRSSLLSLGVGDEEKRFFFNFLPSHHRNVLSEKANEKSFYGATTLVTTTLVLTTFNIMKVILTTFSVTKFSIMTARITRLRNTDWRGRLRLTIVIQEQKINSTEHIRLRGRHLGIVADVVSGVDDSFRLLLRIYCLELLVVIGVMSETYGKG